MLNRRERIARRQSKRAVRATEQGIAGHKAAMSAIHAAVYNEKMNNRFALNNDTEKK